MEILQEFYDLRLRIYQKRKDYLLGMLEAEAGKLSNQARFIMEKCSGEIVVENKKRKTIVEELIKRGYPPDPVAEWKTKNLEDDDNEEAEEESQEEPSQEEESKKKKPDSGRL